MSGHELNAYGSVLTCVRVLRCCSAGFDGGKVVLDTKHRISVHIFGKTAPTDELFFLSPLWFSLETKQAPPLFSWLPG